MWNYNDFSMWIEQTYVTTKYQCQHNKYWLNKCNKT